MTVFATYNVPRKNAEQRKIENLCKRVPKRIRDMQRPSKGVSFKPAQQVQG